jgi:hypothetical protein
MISWVTSLNSPGNALSIDVIIYGGSFFIFRTYSASKLLGVGKKKHFSTLKGHCALEGEAMVIWVTLLNSPWNALLIDVIIYGGSCFIFRTYPASK